jgi:hypothetical protein
MAMLEDDTGHDDKFVFPGLSILPRAHTEVRALYITHVFDLTYFSRLLAAWRPYLKSDRAEIQ